jgi:hypothetical protein
MSAWALKGLSSITISMTQVSGQSAIGGFLTGAAGGIIGGGTSGFVTGLALTGDFGKAWKMSKQSAIIGGITGGALGGYRGYKAAQNAGKNPWTGEEMAQTSNTNNSPSKPAGIPDNWVEKPSNKGGGTVYQDPNNPHNSIRVMPGNPNSPNPAQQKPYVIYRHNGITYDVNGLSLPNSSVVDAHIPYELFNINNFPR